jgi:hypothetical protein
MMSKTLKAFAIAGALAGVTAATANAHSHTAYQHMLSEHQLNNVILGARAQGYNRLVINHRSEVTAANEVSFVVLLQGGTDYRFASLCDGGCGGLRLTLRDAAGREIAADRNDEGAPRFNAFIPQTGAYVVTVALSHCGTERCNVGAVVLTRTAPSPEAGQLPHLA